MILKKLDFCGKYVLIIIFIGIILTPSKYHI